jgi:xanthine dehydrogenase small subunit
MRASAAYRSEVLGNLVQRFWLESQGLEHINLEAVIPQLVIPDPGSESGAGPIRDPWIAGQARNDNSVAGPDRGPQ